MNVIRYKVISLNLFFYLFISQLPREAQNPLLHVLCYDMKNYDIPKATKPVDYWPNFQNHEANTDNLTIISISLPCKKMFNTYDSTFGEEASDATF